MATMSICGLGGQALARLNIQTEQEGSSLIRLAADFWKLGGMDSSSIRPQPIKAETMGFASLYPSY